MNDLDCTTAGYEELASPTANGGKGWQPIGTWGDSARSYFDGILRGQGYEIRDLFINRPGEDNVGLFGATVWGGPNDITVVDFTVTGGDYVGVLVGRNDGQIYNCYCAAGSVTGNSSVGGLAGRNEKGFVSNSYSTGNVTGTERVGGLVGYNEGGTVSNCYSIGTVTGGESVGGLVGGNTGTVSNSFWDIETSGRATSAGGTGKTTAEMKSVATFAGWNIMTVANPTTRNPSYIWNIVEGQTYPFLSWQSVLTPQNQQPIEITSVLGPIGLPNPAGPIVEITLKNLGVEPVISLAATLKVSSASGIPFDFTFDDVSPLNPLQPDGSTSDTRCLIGGGFSSNEWYFLKIHVTLEDGAEFVYTERVQIAAPG
jgi:hypothetical protein